MLRVGSSRSSTYEAPSYISFTIAFASAQFVFSSLTPKRSPADATALPRTSPLPPGDGTKRARSPVATERSAVAGAQHWGGGRIKNSLGPPPDEQAPKAHAKQGGMLSAPSREHAEMPGKVRPSRLS